MVLKDLMKTFGVVTLSFVLVLLINFLRIYFFDDSFLLVLVTEIFKVIPAFLFSKRLLGLLVFSLIVGLIFGSVQSLIVMEENPEESLPLTIFVSTLTTLMSSTGGLYAYKRAKNPVFLVFLPIALFFSVLIAYFYTVYRVWFLALLSPIFLS